MFDYFFYEVPQTDYLEDHKIKKKTFKTKD